MFITIEGVEGTGKTTLGKRLHTYLQAQGHQVLASREPGGTPVGDRLRALFLDQTLNMHALTEVLVVNAARAELLQTLIKPALERGTLVLCDRYIDATYAYQGYGRGIELTLLRTACELATGGLEPDLTLLLDLDVRQGLARQGLATPDRIEREGLEFHERVRQGYLALARDSARFRVIDAAQTPDAVFAEVVAHVNAAL